MYSEFSQSRKYTPGSKVLTTFQFKSPYFSNERRVQRKLYQKMRLEMRDCLQSSCDILGICELSQFSLYLNGNRPQLQEIILTLAECPRTCDLWHYHLATHWAEHNLACWPSTQLALYDLGSYKKLPTI